MKLSARIASWAFFAFASCASTTERLLVPPLEATTSCFQGSIRSGPQPREDAAPRTAPDALSLEYTLTFVEHLSDEALAPVPERTELVLAARGGELLRPTSELGRKARVALGPPAQSLRRSIQAGESGRAAPAAREFAALSRGITSEFSIRFPEELRVPGEGTARRRFALQIARAAGQDGELTAALVIEDLATLADDANERAVEAQAKTAQSRVLQRECVLLADRPQVDGPPLALTLRAPAFGPDAGFALWVDVRSPAALGALASRHTSAFELCEQQLSSADSAKGSLARASPESELYRREIDGLFQALDLERYHRSALVFLAESTGAELAEDFALVAMEADLSAYVKTVVEHSKGRQVLATDAAGVGWLLERSACLFAASRMDGAGLPAELRARVLARAGQVGTSGGDLQSAALESADLAAFRARLIEDNWIALGDAQPAPRVRAFDWLRKRGEALLDFDPLASREERRASLRKALDAQEARAPVR